MTTENTELWIDKYRPQRLDDYILNPDLKDYFRSMIEKKSLQNMLFAGPAGMGKTTLARLLAKEIGCETLFVKCATEGTVDVLRTRIADFCNAMTMDGKLKVIILDELDSASATGQNSFQLGLRTTIEAAQDDTRFLCSCNYSTKIIPAVMSRCPLIPLKFDKKDLLQRVKLILESEKVSYDRESLKSFIEEAFRFYPDVRRIINYLQFCCKSGKLVVKISEVVDSDRAGFVSELMAKALGPGDLLDVRRFWLANKDKAPDFVALGSDVFDWAVDNDAVTEDGVIKLSDQLFQLNAVIDKEAGLFGMVTAVRRYAKRKGGEA